MIQEGYSPSSTNNNRSYPLSTELRNSTILSSGFSTRFPLHKGVPSQLKSPSGTSPYQCRFLSSKHQTVVHYFSSLDSGILYFRVITLKLDEFPIFFKETSHFFSICDLKLLCSQRLFSMSLLLMNPIHILFSQLSCVCYFYI
jgi:hypothetical protein